MNTVLVVDDDAKIQRAISVRLVAAGYTVLTACNGNEALTMVQSRKPDLVITDIWMPVGVGFSLAYRLKETAPEIPIIFLTASKQANLKDMARNFGAVGFLEKPYDHNVLLGLVSKALGSPEKAGEPSPALKS